MPARKGNTPDKIKDAARAIFARQGYQNTSIQQIAAAVGISAPGIYKHFEGKDALFSALVDPLIEQIGEIFHLAEGQKDGMFERGQSDRVWDKAETFARTLDFIYDNFTDMKLLICRAAGTEYEDILDRVADSEAQIMLDTLPGLRKKGLAIPEIEEETARLMMRHQYRTYAEFIRNDYPRERAEAYLRTASAFFTAGWRALLGF